MGGEEMVLVFAGAATSAIAVANAVAAFVMRRKQPHPATAAWEITVGGVRHDVRNVHPDKITELVAARVAQAADVDRRSRSTGRGRSVGATRPRPDRCGAGQPRGRTSPVS